MLAGISNSEADMHPLPEEIFKVQRDAELVHAATAVDAALDSMAQRIAALLSNAEPLLLCVLTGGIVPCGRLLPRLSFPLDLDYVHATRYQGGIAGHALEWRAWPATPLKERTVLLVDDIFDEGVTLAGIAQRCRVEGAHQVFSAVLALKRHDRNRTGMRPDVVGLEVPDRYVFGCGMDYRGYLRNLPAIYAAPAET